MTQRLGSRHTPSSAFQEELMHVASSSTPVIYISYRRPRDCFLFIPVSCNTHQRLEDAILSHKLRTNHFRLHIVQWVPVGPTERYFYFYFFGALEKDSRGADKHLEAIQLSWEAFGRPEQRRDPPKSSDRICFGLEKIKKNQNILKARYAFTHMLLYNVS